ncbi:MAG TPA: glutamate-5-semialdehyde dehydrogenase, partial [Ruminococcaceae bacterium]|nr:glutamate-5-semialdehyde dehydrogenase [Oscillospiraceae bacterium]
MSYITELGARAKAVRDTLATASSAEKDKALLAIADALESNTAVIRQANQLDLENGKENGMSVSLLDRLALNDERIYSIASGVRAVVALPDPVGVIEKGSVRPNGLRIESVRVPLGTIGMIYEARPNVTVDAAVLCLKSGNAVILRGGKEALNTNKALADIMRRAIQSAGMNADCIQLVENTSHEVADEMMRLNDYIDVLIPRGGAGLINRVVANATVPVIQTGVGNCHIYIDKTADENMAVDIVFNAKTSRPSVCNAAESLVVHRDIAERVLPQIKQKLDEKNVIFYGDETACSILKIEAASEEDWAREYLDYKMSVKIVDNLDDAIHHINRFSTGHSEAIITNDYQSAQQFTARVNSS